MVDLKKYSKKKFSKSPALDKKIKALYLLFDQKAEDLKLSYWQMMKALNNWIDIFITKEEYELAHAFKMKKIGEWKRWRKIHRLASVKLFWRVWQRRIWKLKKLFLNLLNGTR